jgi:hypothetical protein
MAACNICSDARYKEINRRLLCGGRIKKTAMEFGFSPGQVQWHKRHHLPFRNSFGPKAATAQEKLEELEYELARLQVLAECGESVGGALRVIVAKRSLLELQLRKEGFLDATHRKLMMASRAPAGEFEVQFVGGRPKAVAVGEK